jgi:hypothetical protein
VLTQPLFAIPAAFTAPVCFLNSLAVPFVGSTTGNRQLAKDSSSLIDSIWAV